jgi:xanthine dehydrogenase accessory factor
MATRSDDSGFHFKEDILAIIAGLQARRKPFALATVIATEGSASAIAGSKAVFDSKGGIIAGWVGGGCAQSTVAHAAIETIESAQTQIVELDLNDEVLGTGMPCGGSMKVYVEPVLPRPTLWVLGHGRIAECLCSIGAMMGLDVAIDDPLATRSRYPDATLLLVEDPGYEALAPQPNDFVVIATQHKGDHESMLRVLATDVGYVALIASHKRTRLVLDYLRKAGLDSDRLARVRAPAGLDLGAPTPEEIALSVIGEIVRLRRTGSCDSEPISDTNSIAPGSAGASALRIAS